MAGQEVRGRYRSAEGPPRGLNPTLVRRIERFIGPVRIANEGEPATTGAPILNPMTGRMRSSFANSGEYYTVSCFAHADRGHHLWIHHRYGTEDPISKRPITWAAICYHGCLEDYENRAKLRKMLLGDISPDMVPRVFRVRPAPHVYDQTLIWPGDCLRLDQLPSDHEAVRYLVSRRFDPVELSKVYDIRYCRVADPSFSMMRRRIVIPVFQDGKLVDWQGRWPGELDWKTTRIPKYYNYPGGHKARYLYSYDLALAADALVLVESVNSCWRIGREAVALRGKTMSDRQFQLVRDWYKRRDGPIVVLLDGGADERKKATEIVAKLKTTITGKVIRMDLPDGRDPADFDRVVIRQMLANKIAAE